jgi:uncharacterized protein YbjT (DUF2867 family)
VRILILGASGFIGSAIGHALLARGDELRALGRDPGRNRATLPAAEWVAGDLRQLTEPNAWTALLYGIDAVINASGALQSGLRDDLVAVQDRAIAALVRAAEQAGVQRFVQISAAGAGTQPREFMQTKARGDEAVAASGLSYTILRPGLVIGRNAFGGTELLRSTAGLPLVGIEIAGTGEVQCVALADVVVATLRGLDGLEGSYDLVEADSRPLGTIIALHRRWLGLPSPRIVLRMPIAALRPLSLVADALGWLGWRSPLRSNAVAALVQGVRGDVAATRAALGREPLSLTETLVALGPAGKADRWHARLSSLYPIALAALFVLWLAGGAVGLANLDHAAVVLETGGLKADLARALVIAGSLADLAIAAGLLVRPALKWALGGGAALAAAYAIGATIVRPDLWLDPLGSMVKVVPVIALSLLCLAMAEER